MEFIGYTRYTAAFGGGIAFGGSFNSIGLGISLLYAQDAEKFISLEALAHIRWYFLRMKYNIDLFGQFEVGIVSFWYEELEIAGQFGPFPLAMGLVVGLRIPCKTTRLFIEPVIRGGIPYLWGASFSVGWRFD